MDEFVYITFPTLDEARALGKSLVQAHLAGCVNIFLAMESIYEWNGELCQESEVVLIAKTTTDKLDSLTSLVKDNHSYSTPCIASFQVEHQNAEYAKWLHRHLKT